MLTQLLHAMTAQLLEAALAEQRLARDVNLHFLCLAASVTGTGLDGWALI